MQPVDQSSVPITRSPKFRTERDPEDNVTHKCQQCGNDILANQVTMFGRPRVYLHMECFVRWNGREVGKK